MRQGARSLPTEILDRARVRKARARATAVVKYPIHLHTPRNLHRLRKLCSFAMTTSDPSKLQCGRPFGSLFALSTSDNEVRDRQVQQQWRQSSHRSNEQHCERQAQVRHELPTKRQVVTMAATSSTTSRDGDSRCEHSEHKHS